MPQRLDTFGIQNWRRGCSPRKQRAGSRRALFRMAIRSPRRCWIRRRVPGPPISCAWRWSELIGNATIRAGSAFLASPLCFWNHIPWIYSEKWDLDRSTYLPCFALVLERCHANVSGRFGMTILHYAAASYNWIKPEERVAFVRMLLDHGARLDVRDDLLRSTPLG